MAPQPTTVTQFSLDGWKFYACFEALSGEEMEGSGQSCMAASLVLS